MDVVVRTLAVLWHLHVPFLYVEFSAVSAFDSVFDILASQMLSGNNVYRR